MYEDGFKWWSLGSASSVAFVLFLFMLACGRIKRRDRGREPPRRPPGPGRGAGLPLLDEARHLSCSPGLCERRPEDDRIPSCWARNGRPIATPPCCKVRLHVPRIRSPTRIVGLSRPLPPLTAATS